MIPVLLATASDVREWTERSVRERCVGLDRSHVAGITLAVVIEGVVQYAEQHGDPVRETDVEALAGWLAEFYSHPSAALRNAHRVLVSVRSVRAIEALAESVTDAAWATLAGFELRARRGATRGWRLEPRGAVELPL